MFNKLQKLLLLLSAAVSAISGSASVAAPIAHPPLFFPLHNDGRPWCVGAQDMLEDGSNVTHFYLVTESEESWTERLWVRSFPRGPTAEELIELLMETVRTQHPDNDVTHRIVESSKRSALVEWSSSDSVSGIHRVIVDSEVAIALTYSATTDQSLARWRTILAETGLVPDYG